MANNYPDFYESTQYGEVTGLGGANCRHSFYPYFEGVSTPAYSEKELTEIDSETVNYMGKDLKISGALQKQRYHERQIRRWKREERALKRAGQDQRKATEKVRKWQKMQRDFTAQTGLKRDYTRERR